MGKSSPSMPAPPDPAAAAQAQGAANLDAARQAAQLNRYDVYTPYGAQTWQQAYSPQDRAALDRWQQEMDGYTANVLPAWTAAQQAGAPQAASGQYIENSDQGWHSPGGGQQAPAGPMPAPPQRPDVHPGQWTQTIALTPDGQANLDLQNRLTNQALSFGNDQVGRVAGTVGQPLSFADAPPTVPGVGQTIGGAPGIGADAQARFLELSRQLQGADPQQVARAQQQFFAGLDAGDVGGIVRDNPQLQGMALGNAGQRLAMLYGPGEGGAMQRWTAGVQGLMAQGMDVAAAHNQVLGQMSGGDLAQILQDPNAATYGAAARGAIAQRADQLAAAANRPDQGAGAVQRRLDLARLPAMPRIDAAPQATGPWLQAQGQGAGPGAGPYGLDLSRQGIEDALYRRAAARLDPQWQQQEQALAAQLANQGIPIGSAAYDAEMDRFARARNDAYAAATNDAILAGGGEQSRLFGLGLAGRQQGFDEALAGATFANAAQGQAYGQARDTRAQIFNEGMTVAQQDFYQQQQNAALQNAARQQAIQEQLLLRNQPINELVALLGTSGGVQMPQFGAPAAIGVAAPDVMGATYDSYAGQMNAYNAAQQRNAAGMQGLGSLLGTGLRAAASGGWF
ncbi:MAG: hypothetical protein RIB84_15760 [Sneathiellaceae bacterium]